MAFRGIRQLVWLAALGPAGCLWVPVPADIHAGPGRRLALADAETRQPLDHATALIERYRLEGPLHAAPVVRLERLDEITPVPPEGYRLARTLRWRRMWLVWMPEVRYSPVQQVVAVKAAAPGHETVWFAVRGPLDGLNVEDGPAGRVLYLRPIATPAEREAAIDALARHGWPPGESPVMADVVVPDDVRARLAPIMIAQYERLLADFPAYEHAARVRVSIERWRKALK